AGVVIGHADGDGVGVGWRPGRIVVQILVTGTEAENTRGKAQGGAALARAPVDDHGVRILRTRVNKRASQGEGVILANGAGVQHQVVGGDVVHGHTRAFGVRGAEVIGHAHADRVAVRAGAGWVIVQILVRRREAGDTRP